MTDEERLAEIDDDAKSHLTWGNTYGDGICTTEEIRALVAEVRRLRAVLRDCRLPDAIVGRPETYAVSVDARAWNDRVDAALGRVR